MKIVVLGGSGKIGRAAAWDLARDPEVEAVGLVGRRREALAEVRTWIGAGGDKVVLHPAGIDDRAAMVEILAGYDAAILTLPDRRSSYRAWELAIAAGTHAVDVLEEYHRRPDRHETEGLELPPGDDLAAYGERLHEDAAARGVTLLDGLGLAPGLTNVTLGEGIRFGGIPDRETAARHPLRYVITWAFEHVLREYVIRVEVKKGGRVVEVEAGTDREPFRFQAFGVDEPLECAVTPGMPSFLHTRPDLAEFAEKTVRWPGHWQAVETLKECGLLDLEPVAYDGGRVVPREFFAALIGPRLRPGPGDGDVSVMWNTLTGVQGGRPVRLTWAMWDRPDAAHGLSSMMRTTAFPATIGARYLAQGKIRARGIVAPEDAIAGDLYRDFLARLERRGIVIRRTSEPAGGGG
jgi:lysine 6-dehydrogenase